MSKHTPGRWHAVQVSRSTKENEADYGRICFGPRMGQFEVVFLTERPVSGINEAQANATLACAAPDLLEALEKIKYKMEQGLKPYHAEEFYGDIVTAIARAKGEK